MRTEKRLIVEPKMKNKKIKYRKIRGINRRKRAIEQWGDNHTNLDMDLLNQIKIDYVKFWVQPWYRLPLGNSIYPEPTGDCEYLLIKKLNKIYQSWKSALDDLQKPYYLQIWLFEEYISQAQVVCAIEDSKEFYENIFELIPEQPSNGIQNSAHYNKANAEYLNRFEWRFNQHIRAYDMTDDDDIESFEETDPTKFLRKEIIEGKEHQLVEISRVWLISS